MSAWQVYWLMQLDSISCLVFGLFFISLIALVILLSVSVSMYTESMYTESMYTESCGSNKRNEAKGFVFKTLPILTIIFLALGISSALIPSTKTMAAILVVPKLASSTNINTVSKDGGEIYKLAMERIKDALGEEGEK